MKTKQIVLIAAGVLGAGILLGGAFVLGRQTAGTPTPTPTIAETPTPTLEGTPSPSPSPTKSPTATPTQKPTSTPTPTPTPGVVNIEASVTPTTSDACTKKFDFSAKIYTNAGMTVKYKWLRSDGAASPEQTLTYTEAGMQTVTSDWTLARNSGESFNGWKRIEITSPGSALSNKAEFTLTCP